MIQRQNVTIPLGEGIDTKVDPKLVQGKSLVLENAVFKKIGGIEKRYGLKSAGNDILGGGEITSAKALAVFQDELLLIDNSGIYSYASQNDNWVRKSNISAISADSETLIKNENQQTIPDCAYTKGITVYAWEDSSGGVRASVIDQLTGNPLISNALISATGASPKCSYNNDYLFVWYYETANNIKVKKVSIANPVSFSNAATLTNDAHATVAMDIAKHGNNFVFAYRTSANKIKLAYLKNDGTIATALDGYPGIITIDDDATAISVSSFYQNDLANDGIYLYYHNAVSGITVLVYNLALSSNTTTQIEALVTEVKNITSLNTAAGTQQVWYEVDATNPYDHYVKSAIVQRDGTASTPDVFLRSVGLVSKAFVGSDDNYYLVIAHESTFQPVYFTVQAIDTDTAFVVNRINYQNAGGLTAKNSSLTNVVGISSTKFLIPVVTKVQLRSENGNVYSQTGLQTTILNFDNTQLFSTAVLGGSLHIAGGMLFSYDGSSVVESGYNLYPEDISYTTAAGGDVATGSYQYAVVWEWYDVQGQIHRSAPSIPLAASVAGGPKKVVLTIPTLRITERRGTNGNVSIAIYRTEDAGSIFYRVSSITSPLINDTTADTVTFEDKSADASIITNEILYTTGGILENIVPPSCTNISTYNNRLVISGLEDANEIWLSKSYTQGEAVGFSDFIKTRIDQNIRGITAQAVMDEKIIFFKSNNLFVLAAEGPDNTGLNDDIRIPQIVATDVGCPYPRSIVLTPMGLMFKSARGFYLLDRNLQVQYIGDKVENYNSLTVTGAELIDSQTEVRFVHSDGECLVYNYYKQDWSVFTKYEAINCKEWQGAFVIARSSGVVDIENPQYYLDNGSAIKTKIVTPWVQTAGIQGFQRVMEAAILGGFKSQHKLQVKVGYNFESDWRETFSIDTSVLGSNYYGQDAYYGYNYYGGSVDEVYQFKIRPMIQKCQSIRFEISDANPTLVDGAGFSVVAMSLDVGIKQGLFKTPNSKVMQS